MFEDQIMETRFTSEAAKRHSKVRDCCSNSYNISDASLDSTLRVLIDPRMQKGETLESMVRSSSPDDVRFDRTDFSIDPKTLLIHSYNTIKKNLDFSRINREFEEKFPGWERLEKVTDFFRKSFKVLCFVNSEHKKVVLILENMTLKIFHYLQSATLAFFPWYFDPQKDAISEEELKLIKSLTGKSAVRYQECLNEIAKKYDFETEHIRQTIKNFKTTLECKMRDHLKEKISTFDSQIRSQEAQISSLLKERRECEVSLLAWELKEHEDSSSELADYFSTNASLSLDGVNAEGELEFSVKSYCEYFDEEIAKTVINNPNSYVYRPRNTYLVHIKEADIKRLMNAVFVDQTIKLRLCAAYTLSAVSQRINCRTFHFNWFDGEYTPNPHIDRFGCLGTYINPINKMLREYNYIGVIEQCIASCKSINFTDSPVMREFLEHLYGTKEAYKGNKCLELPSGLVATPEEAIKWLKAQEDNNEQKTDY